MTRTDKRGDWPIGVAVGRDDIASPAARLKVVLGIKRLIRL